MRNVDQQQQLERGGEEAVGIAVGTMVVPQVKVGMPVDISSAAAMGPPATSEGVSTLWMGAVGAELVLATMVVVAGGITRMHAILEMKPTAAGAAVATVVVAAAAATVAPIVHSHHRTPQRLCRPFHRRRSGGAPPHCTTRHRRHRPVPGSNGERVGSYTCLG